MKTKTYSKGNTTVVWQPDKCYHSENCYKGLPEVFNPEKKPWVNMAGASEKAIREQVAMCPSGALSIKEKDQEDKINDMSDVKIKVSPAGPLMVSGNCTIELKDGKTEVVEKVAALCRCGASNNKPYCDGSHSKVDFDK
ncbi:(4Fe-4S)-binding protein [Mangrovivirga cuniculi]|uniref:Iron-binding zinc finger CDGSH type domain-containing protein n=1 Tax=Mangrovivirga cuniculi TaxID=2715131 RepID=A0A4D7JS33_9BACT|nr:(4Fe-4S)-binding protein [Mangrovivirga cuniculi]QCK16330.1 hypothetical protein DCC35_17110 [Mangrovivirga cuniculi]